jgi:hypothetical protein
MDHEYLPCRRRVGAQSLLKPFRYEQIGTDDQQPSARMTTRICFECQSEISFAAWLYLLDEPQHLDQARFSLCRSELTAHVGIERRYMKPIIVRQRQIPKRSSNQLRSAQFSRRSPRHRARCVQ